MIMTLLFDTPDFLFNYGAVFMHILLFWFFLLNRFRKKTVKAKREAIREIVLDLSRKEKERLETKTEPEDVKA